MKRLFIIFSFVISVVVAKAQKNDTTIYYGCRLKNDTTPYVGVHVKNDQRPCLLDFWPKFPGGEKAFNKFLLKHMIWPGPYYDAQGRVLLSLVIEKNGSLSNIKVERSVTPEFDKEALRLAKLMPKWHPAKMKGKPVRLRLYVPIPFKMD